MGRSCEIGGNDASRMGFMLSLLVRGYVMRNPHAYALFR